MAQVGVLDLLHSTDIFRFNFQSPASMQPNPNDKCNDPTMDGDYLTATQPAAGEPGNTTPSLNSNFRLESYVLPMALLLPSTSSSPIPHPRPCSSGTKFPLYPPPDRQPGGPAQPSASAPQCPPPSYLHEPVRLAECDVSLDHLVLQSIFATGILVDAPSSLVTARSTITIPALQGLAPQSGI